VQGAISQGGTSPETSTLRSPAPQTDGEALQSALRRAAYAKAKMNASEHEKYLKSESIEDESLTAIAQKILDNRMTSYQKQALHDLLRTDDMSQTPVHSVIGSTEAPDATDAPAKTSNVDDPKSIKDPST
jgi:hypothetical protein